MTDHTEPATATADSPEQTPARMVTTALEMALGVSGCQGVAGTTGCGSFARRLAARVSPPGDTRPVVARLAN